MIYWISVCLIVFYAVVRFRRELQMMQQNSYRPERYWRWARGQEPGRELVLDALTGGIFGAFYVSVWAEWALAGVALASAFRGAKLLMVRSKKPLVMTARAWRIFGVGVVIIVATVLLSALIGRFWPPLVAIFMAVAAPLVAMLAVVILTPVERAINRWYVEDARRILREMPGLLVIGVTGSYGKTTTKHYLHRILSERFSVVMTPGSFNTTLGVVRTIRECLKPYTEVFIVEMGAKQPGDIAEICELVRPRIGIVTAVGEQHLETFGSVENVQRTKFELIDALPPDGIAVLNDDFEMVRHRAVTNVEKVIRYGAAMLSDVKYGRDETTFAVDGERMSTKLVGIHNMTNILAGYLVGRELGLTAGEMRHAIGSLEAVEHRLSMRNTAGGLTIVDDAFNSNPHGAAMALDVLAGMEGGKRIVVTPGMIELGARQEKLNCEFGQKIAQSVDVAIIVGEHNREAIAAGLGDFEGAVFAKNFDEASAHVRQIARAGDVILYENDLPDTFK